MKAISFLIGKKKVKARASYWMMPYNGKKAAYQGVKKCGLYMIRSKKSQKILFVGYSGYDLKKTMYRHFQSWSDPSQKRAVYKNRALYQVKVIECSCNAAQKMEIYLIQKYRPRDNILKYQGSLFSKPIKIQTGGFNRTKSQSFGLCSLLKKSLQILSFFSPQYEA